MKNIPWFHGSILSNTTLHNGKNITKYNALNVSLVLPVQHVATKIRSY